MPAGARAFQLGGWWRTVEALRSFATRLPERFMHPIFRHSLRSAAGRHDNDAAGRRRTVGRVRWMHLGWRSTKLWRRERTRIGGMFVSLADESIRIAERPSMPEVEDR